MKEIAAIGNRVAVVIIRVRFLLPAEAGDELVVSMFIQDLRDVSRERQERITRGGYALFEAKATAACTSLKGRPSRTPAPPQQALEALASST